MKKKIKAYLADYNVWSLSIAILFFIATAVFCFYDPDINKYLFAGFFGMFVWVVMKIEMDMQIKKARKQAEKSPIDS